MNRLSTVWGCLLLALMAVSPLTFAKPLDIEIRRGQDQLISIAIVPPSFVNQGGVHPKAEVEQIIANNLRRTGYFSPMSTDFMLEKPTRSDQVNWQKWRLQDVSYLVVGRLIADNQKRLQYEFQLLDVASKKVLLTKAFRTSETQLRRLAHIASNHIYQVLTEIPGAFDSKLAYVRKLGQQYDLIVADSDGLNAVSIYKSKEAILSPSWSPDTRFIAFVNYKNRFPFIRIIDVKTGKVDTLPSAKGLNSAPAWSPDGKLLALVRSYENNPDIYLYDVAKRKIKAVTRHWGIDTEPAWFPDGKHIAFTSNRAGKPHIYKINIRSKEVKRLTFDGIYHARPRLIDNGERLATVHRPSKQDAFYLSVTNLKTQKSYVLNQIRLDESPALSDNGAVLVYATKNRKGQNRLMVASINGRVVEPLIAPAGDIREPAWSSSLR